MKKILMLFTMLAAIFLLIGCENTQRKAYNIKADIVGSDRTAKIYSPLDGKLLDTVTDSAMVIEPKSNAVVTLWCGSNNKKVYVQNATVIVKDN